MEQKKIMLVTISVGVFLVIVIGAAIFILGNGSSNPLLAPARTIPAGTSGRTIEVTGIPSIADLTFIEPSNATENDSEELPAATVQVTNGIEITTPEQTPGGPVTIAVGRPSTAAVPDVAPTPRPGTTAPAQTAAPRTTTAPAPAPAARATPAAVPQASPPPPPAARPAAPPAQVQAPAPRAQTNFWVQTGSFSTLTRAEGVRETLSARGISSVIENRVIDGSLYYRVRVGPYTTRNEANYWLALIRSIDGFESSQVWQNQTVN